ncbi:MAG TPA: acyltransferase family protein [Steroidobacteraceae bacterium]|nr:acyltransferase family protein [Steroidobacteraceae bacterium]
MSRDPARLSHSSSAPVTSPLQQSSQRILSVDATRGLAMAFVALSHFSWTLEHTQPRLADILESVAMIASPTFLLLSGAMLGLLQLRRKNRLPELASRLFHRGLFVLVVGHLLISGASALAHNKHYLDVVLDRVYITDVVGICLMLLPRITAQAGVKPLVATGISLFLAALLISYLWQPTQTASIVVEQMLFGSHGHRGRQLMEYASPIIPYIGVYIAGIGLGSYLDRVAGGALEARESWRIVGVAVGMVFAAICAKAAWVFAHLDVQTPAGRVLHELTSPFQKLPPGPTYLLTFAGLGILALCAFFWLERRSPKAAPLTGFAILGQCSFAVFILQFYIFGPMSDFPQIFGGSFWWASYLGAMAVIFAVAMLWRRARGNRLFDVTYTLSNGGGKLAKPLGDATS